MSNYNSMNYFPWGPAWSPSMQYPQPSTFNNQLQLDQAMQGVVRYPNGFMYNAGNNPFCGCNNATCCNI